MRKSRISHGYQEYRIMHHHLYDKCREKIILRSAANRNTVTDINGLQNPPVKSFFILNGKYNPTGIQPLANYLSTDSKIYQNYSNFFIETVQIPSFLKPQDHVKQAVNSCFGEKIKVLEYAMQTAGACTVGYNSSGIAAGIYFYSLTSLEERELRMMLRVK
jgi:hypothetical protein